MSKRNKNYIRNDFPDHGYGQNIVHDRPLGSLRSDAEDIAIQVAQCAAMHNVEPEQVHKMVRKILTAERKAWQAKERAYARM